MTKKILLIVSILAIVGIATFLIFTSKPQTEAGDSSVGFSIRDYLPFGKSGNENTTDGDTTNNANPEDVPPINQTEESVPRLRKVSNESVAGAVVFNIGATTTVRFVEKGTGNVYEVKSDSTKVTRLTNTTIPKIIRAFWLPNGSGFLAQTLDAESEIIETSFVKLYKNIASSTNENLTPFGTTIGKLPTGIKEITIKPDGTKIFYYTLFGINSKWFMSNPDGTGSSLLVTHPLTEWVPKWISGNTVVMQTKSSFETTGFAYLFDVSTKNLKRVGVGDYGLSINPNQDGSISIASGGGSFPKISVIDNKNTTLKSLGINGLSEKCVWSKEKSPSVYCAIPSQIPTGNYPDVWYKGLISTEDFIEKIDLNNDMFVQIADLSDLSSQKIDVVDPSLSPDGSHLIFRNKIDGYLWLLRVVE